jgi:hypothetical protein
MKKTAFIHTNNKQLIGALIAKHAIESRLMPGSTISVSIINVDELDIFKEFRGSTYLFTKGDERTYIESDLQSFTLSRFMPPELMGYEGRAVVIDPDIFALTNIEELFELPMGENAILACRKKDAWDTSVMLMDCGRLPHWKIATLLQDLGERKRSYSDIMTMRTETAPIGELSRVWNHLDEYTPETKIIHMTGRLTQPWRTGLPIDFTRNKAKKLFGIIPREPILKLLGKYPSHYQKHPNPKIEQLFFDLAKAALKDGAITRGDINKEIALGHVRPDISECLA